MKSYEDYILDTKAKRDEVTKRVEAIAEENNGRVISPQDVIRTAVEIATEISAVVTHGEIRMYHEWLMEQLGK